MKKFLALLLCLCLTTGLAACGNSKKPEKEISSEIEEDVETFEQDDVPEVDDNDDELETDEELPYEPESATQDTEEQSITDDSFDASSNYDDILVKWCNIVEEMVDLWTRGKIHNCTYTYSYDEETNLASVFAKFNSDEANPEQKASIVENFIKTKLKFDSIKTIVHLGIVITDSSGNVVLSTLDGEPVEL